MVQQTLVFISHTQSMRTHPAGQFFVDGAEEAVNSVDGAKAFHMRFFPAADEPPAAYSLRQLEKADVFLAVIGFDPGSRVLSDGRSYTELEFDGATAPTATLALMAVVVLVATAVRGAFPPWAAQGPCDGVTARARAVAVPFPVPRPVGAVEVVIRNDTDGRVDLPAARDVTARGTNGEQYATDSPPGDQNWFFGVSVQPRSTRTLLLGVSASSRVADRITLVVPGVRGAGGPLVRCRITVAPVKVTIGPTA